jgi:hypothetical protein
MTEVEKFCKKHRACSDGAKWASQYEKLAEVYDACSRSDWLIWMLRKAEVLKKAQSVECAIEFAARVLPIFEERIPEDKRPREAIDAARYWLANPCKAYANVAHAAAAAYTAAYAADDDADSANAAAYAANAAADDAAAREAEYTTQADIIRRIVPNPWRAE